jgi:hypothetical protein
MSRQRRGGGLNFGGYGSGGDYGSDGGSYDSGGGSYDSGGGGGNTYNITTGGGGYAGDVLGTNDYAGPPIDDPTLGSMKALKLPCPTGTCRR